MRKPTEKNRWLVWLLACLVMLVWSQTSAAVTINLTYDHTDDNPSWDSDGSDLGDIMSAAADYWEAIIQDPWTLDIEYRWADLSGDLGLHTSQGSDPWAGGRREVEGRIELDSAFLWFNDLTPLNHSEYDIESHLVEDDTHNWFYSDPPALVEMDYSGPAATDAPANAISGFDMFTVALHELGHALGMTHSAAQDDVGHYAYDFPAAMVDHQICGVDTYNTDDVYHIAPEDALMEIDTASGQRVLPSATDVMAIAAASDWTNIDLPRQDLWNGYDMNQRDSWEGNNTPDADDVAFARFGTYNSPTDSDIAWMTGDLHFERFTIANGSQVDTNNHRLTIDDRVVIEQAATGSKPALIVDSGGVLDTGVVEINGGELRLTGGIVDAASVRTTELNGQMPSITGSGSVEASYLVNNGEIRAFTDGLLQIKWRGSGTGIDLDGESPGGGQPEPGLMDAQYGDVEITGGGMTDDFHGTLSIGSTGNSEVRYLDVEPDWAVGAGGVVNMVGNSDGSSARRAEIRGGELEIRGWLYASHHALINTPVSFNETSRVFVSEDGLLVLGDTTRLHGTEITGLGTLRQNGDTDVGGNTQIATAIYDMDGTIRSDTYAYGNVFVTSGRLADTYSGHLTSRWGSFNMDLTAASSWTADEQSRLSVYDGGAIGGSTKLILEGTLDTAAGEGTGYINSPIEITATATVDVVAADATLELAGATTWSSPVSVTGGGTLVQTGVAEIVSDTIIDTYYFDWDGSGENSLTQINDGVTLTINAEGLESGVTGGRYDGTVHVLSGTLDMRTNGPWDLGGVMYLNQNGVGTPTLDGEVVRVDGGQINVLGGNAVINAPVRMLGSGLAVSGAATLDHNAALTVEGGTLSVAADGQINANGSTYFHPAGTVHVDGELELNGPVTYQGGTFTGSGVIQQDTPTTISALVLTATTIDVDRFDMDGTSGDTKTELRAPLTLNIDQIDNLDNAFNGTVTIDTEGTLTVNLPAEDSWSMSGSMTIYSYIHSPSVAGSQMRIIGSAPTKAVVNVHGLAAQFDAPVSVHNHGEIALADSSATLTLAGGTLAAPNLMVGGEVTGPGKLAAGAGVALHGYGDIEADLQFREDSQLMADNGVLNLTGQLLDLGGKIGTADGDGTLRVSDPWNTSLANRCELNGGRIEGAAITNDGMIVGHGEIASSGLTNNGTLTALDGTLQINTTSAPDLDGGGIESGQIDAFEGSIHVTYLGFSSGYGFNGKLKIGKNQSFRMDSGWLEVSGGANPGDLTMYGGTYVATDLDLLGTLAVSGSVATIDSDVTFHDVSTTTLDAPLRLLHASTVEAGAAIDGQTDLINESGALLHVHDGGIISADVVNHGALLVGIATPASAQFNGYRQSMTGRMGVDLLGVDPGNQYDQLAVHGPVKLAGDLEISLLFSGTPQDTFDIITHNGRTGRFDTITCPGGTASMHYNQSRTRVIRQRWSASREDLTGVFDVFQPATSLTVNGFWNWSGLVVKQGEGTLRLESQFGSTDPTATLSIEEGAVHLETASRTLVLSELAVVEAGTLNTGTGARLRVDNDLTIRDDGAVNLSGGRLQADTIVDSAGNLNFTGGRLSVDALEGDLTQQGGALAAGSSAGSTAGSTHIIGNYRLNAGELEVELAGLTQGTQYDFYNIDGDVVLAGGLLDVSLIPPFTPTLGQSFAILQVGGSLTGTFSGLSQGAFVGNFGGADLYINYAAGDSNDIALFTVSGLAGDYNNDGTVGVADYVAWRDNLGAPAGTLLNDTDGGVIDRDQYNTWKSGYGNTLGSGSSPAASAPEPGSAVLLIMMSLVLAASTTAVRLRLPTRTLSRK